MLNRQKFTAEVAGKTLTLEISRLAEQANAAVLGTYGDTSVLATTVMGEKNKDIDYFPLVVDYEEKFYAAGKIIGSRFVRREGRPSENAILSGRMIDRSIRPLFDSRLRRDVQVVITVLSYDENNDPDFVSLISASTALAISDIPWRGPIAGLRLVKMLNNETIVNPENSRLADAKNIIFDAFITGTEDKINMIELGGNMAKENEIIEGFNLAHQEIKKLIAFQKSVVEKIGKPKTDIPLAEPSVELKEKINSLIKDKIEEAIYVKRKTDRQDKISALKEFFKAQLTEEENKFSDSVFEEIINDIVHKNIIDPPAGEEKRPDGRKLDEVRELYAEIGLFKRLHGSALFMRGNTQSLAVTTLAAPGAEQLIETMESSGKRRFMFHYNFPPYSTGEIGRLGGPGRREIGHGNLAEKAIKSVIPTQEEFPYAIRVVSEILSSNGSSSMASACSASLSLMDAGVPIKKAVAGIAMGLMVSNDRYKILTDIQGPEDHHGDMDCKIAGSEDGVTAIQMDVKI